MQLENKVAVITGASSGIGKAITLAFANEGAAVVVDYRSHPEAAQETVEQIKSAGGKAAAVRADVTQPEDVRTLIQHAVQEFGRLDVLVNNAGVEQKMPFLKTPLDVWNKAITVNLTGPWLGCQEAAKQLVSQGGPGRIINIASVHEDLPMPTNSPYCAAKGGLRMLMRTIALELAPYGITVNNMPQAPSIRRWTRRSKRIPTRDGEAALGDTAGTHGQARRDSLSGRIPRLRRFRLRDRNHFLHRWGYDPARREPVESANSKPELRRTAPRVMYYR